jgi:histidyl-tRNA synthetase
MIQAVRGMNDVLPSQTPLWQKVEDRLRNIFASYGYHEIRLPILEKTELFNRSIGEATDIVEKEMYTFLDRNSESLTLRPEGTASCVRAAIEHGMLYNQQQKLWYAGPMFRYERPQKGRYRQFHQVGVEAFGFTGPAVEAELILMSARLWRELQLSSSVKLHINTLGTHENRLHYRHAFKAYCEKHYDQLDEDSRRRLNINPLRILDSKDPRAQILLHDAPKIQDYLDDISKRQFENLCDYLQSTGITFFINQHLVRGLDYYTGTVFEWVTESLGAQGAVCAGGRYDGLVEELGGSPTPAVGFAIGMERVIALLEQQPISNETRTDVYLVLMGEGSESKGFILAERLRDALPELRLHINLVEGSFKTQFKRADKSGARFAIVLGEDELQHNVVTLKDLRTDNEQQRISLEALIDYLRSAL